MLLSGGAEGNETQRSLFNLSPGVVFGWDLKENSTAPHLDEAPAVYYLHCEIILKSFRPKLNKAWAHSTLIKYGKGPVNPTQK